MFCLAACPLYTAIQEDAFGTTKSQAYDRHWIKVKTDVPPWYVDSAETNKDPTY